MKKRPNVVFVFGDQWRAQAAGYAGNADVKTPHIDALASESIDFRNAVSGCPVCSPYRGSLLTGQYPLTHGIFVNDVPLNPEAASMGKLFGAEGYATVYIGKWHVDGHGRSAYIPPERRQGFDYWKVLECTHDYSHSAYYAGNATEKSYWQGYDAIEQTKDAVSYIENYTNDNPFLLVLSWGPPHWPIPYWPMDCAPEEFRRLYNPQSISLRDSVPLEERESIRMKYAAYYAHCSALDWCVGQLLQVLDKKAIAENTIFVFTSDHGDMLDSHGEHDKQRPWDESIRVPFLLRYPDAFGRTPRRLDAPIDAPDILPTLLELCDIPLPKTIEGKSFVNYMHGGEDPSEGAALLSCPHPFGNWNREKHGGREYRGIRTTRYTYVKTLDGPWLLYDNLDDPFQKNNLLDSPQHDALKKQLDDCLYRKLQGLDDTFLPGMEYIDRWGYSVNKFGTVPHIG